MAAKRCNGKTRSGGKCQRPAGWGTDHVGDARCKLHGGNTPTHRRAAQLQRQRRAVEALGLSREIDPGEALLQAVWEAAGNVEFYRQLVSDLSVEPEPDELVTLTDDNGDPVRDKDGKPVQHWKHGAAGIWGRTYHISGIETGEAKANILVVLYNEERDRLVKVAKAALDAGVEERRVRIAENQVTALYKGLNIAIAAAKMTPEQADRFNRSFAAELRALVEEETATRLRVIDGDRS